MLKNNKNPLLTGLEVANTNKSFKVPNDQDFGIDYLHLRVDLDPSTIDVSSSIWGINSKGKAPEPDQIYNAYYTHLPFGQSEVDVQINLYDMRVFLRFNPSTVLFGKGKTLLHPKAIVGLVDSLLNSLAPYCRPIFDVVDDQGTITRHPNWATQVWVSRIDCSRNMVIDDPMRFKKGIEAALPRHKKTTITYKAGKEGWGIVNATKSNGHDKIYDKDVELDLHNVDESLNQTEGTSFRFETQLKRDRISKFGLRRLSDVTDEAVWKAIEERWDACRWGVTINEPGSAVKAMESLTSSEKNGLIAYLGKHHLGIEYEITVSGHRKYGALARNLGFTLGEPLEAQGKAFRKADIWAGCLVDVP